MENNLFAKVFQLKIYINIVLLFFLIWKAFSFIRNFRQTIQQKNNIEQDEHFVITNSLKKSLRYERLGKMIAFEICSFYYCFLKWKNTDDTENSFSGNHQSGLTAIYLGLILVSIIEAVGFHAVLIARHRNLAFLFLVLHVYLVINLIGHLKAVWFRSHLILSEKIIFRYGLFETIEIPFNSIDSISKFEGDYEKSPELLKLALLGKLEPHNISLDLKNLMTIHLPFGITKNTAKIFLHVDDANGFIKIVMRKIGEEENLKNKKLLLSL
ncbi:hypothetical protein [Flavobacterium hungaricum]|nr:hypothetical protein [Flavobacterium hungaricum]